MQNSSFATQIHHITTEFINCRDNFPTAATNGGLKWNSAVDATAKATIGYDKSEAHHGYASLKIDYRFALKMRNVD